MQRSVPDNYGFPMVGYNVPGGEEASIYYNWEWLYGALEPGEYRMVWDVSRKDSGSASCTDIPGAYTFSTLERGKANEEKSIMDNRGMYHPNQYMGY